MKWTVENQEKARRKGGIDAVIEALKVHTNNFYVCEYGCCALKNIISDRGN